MNSTPKIGISFSGGGARAAAHIGAIQALNEKGIKADYIAGTSGGAIVGSLYAAGVTPDKMLELAAEGSLYKLYKLGLPVHGLTSIDYLGELLEKYIGINTFADLPTPLTVTVTNLMTGRKEFINSGSLYPAVMASCAVPLVFNPVEINDQMYADGGIFDNMPVGPLKDSCDIIIGVNLVPDMPLLREQLDSMFAIGMRVFDLAVANNTHLNFPFCDVVINPQEVAGYGIFNFKVYETLYQIGYKAAQAKVEEIIAIIEQKIIKE